MPEVAEKFESWGICEVMGHVRLAGLIREETVFGVAMVRVDVPKTQAREGYTRYFGAASIYGITPTSEETACYNAENIERYSSPVPYTQPRQLQAGEPVAADVVYDDEIRGEGDLELDDEEIFRLTREEAHALVLRTLREHHATDKDNALPAHAINEAARELLGRDSATLEGRAFDVLIRDMQSAGLVVIDEETLEDMIYLPGATLAPALATAVTDEPHDA